MRRLLALALGLLCTSAQAYPRYPAQWWRKNPQGSLSKKVSAALTASNCDGSAQTLSDGTAISWTRSTTATCTKNDGSFAAVTTGQPRCNQDGCFVEPAATNIAQYSEQFSNTSGWSLNTTGSGTLGSITADSSDVTDPFGTNFEDKFTCPNMVGGEGGTNLCASLNNFTISGLSGSYTLSRYSRTLSGTRISYLWANGGAPSTTVTCTNTSTWSRCTNTQTAPGNFRMGYDLRAQQTGQIAGSVYWFGAQLESGAIATSYIPTTSASATRNADNASFTTPTWLADTQGCVSVTVKVPTVVAGGRVLTFGSNGAIFLNDSTTVRVTDGTNTVSATVTDVTNRSVVIQAYWSGSTLGLVADGVTATGTYDGTIINSTTYLGSTSGSSNFLYGYLSALKLGSTITACN